MVLWYSKGVNLHGLFLSFPVSYYHELFMVSQARYVADDA